MSGTKHIPNPWLAIKNLRRRVRILEVKTLALKSPITGAMMWQFDDCWYEQKEVLDHMASQKQRATLAITKQDLGASFGYAIGHPDCLDIDDILLAESQGHEIANHTLNHIDMRAASATTRATQLDDLQTELIGYGITPPTTFIYPYGYRNGQTDRDLATRFGTFRYAGYGVNALTPARRFRIGATEPASDATDAVSSGQVFPDDIKRWLELALTKPLVLSFFCHLGPGYVNEPTVAEIISVLDYAAELGIPCVTVRELVEGMNVTPNASFEYGEPARAGDTYARINGWPIYVAGNSAVNETIRTVTPYPGGDGTKAWEVVLTGAGQGASRGFRTPVEPGKDIYMSGRCYIDLGGPTYTARDTFTRSVSNGWGNANTGGAYTRVGGAAADFSVDGTTGHISPSGSTAEDMVLLTPSIADGEIVFRVRFNKDSNNNNDIRCLFRHQGGVNNDHVRVDLTDGAFAGIYFRIAHVSGGAETVDVGYQPIAGSGAIAYSEYWYVRVQFRGTTIRARFWPDIYDEPDNIWHYNSAIAGLPTAAGGVGLGCKATATNTPFTFDFDDYVVTIGENQGAANGIRMQAWTMDANGSVITTINSEWFNADTNGGWKFFGKYSAITVEEDALFLEVHVTVDGLVGTFRADHIVVGLASLQPDGPLG